MLLILILSTCRLFQAPAPAIESAPLNPASRPRFRNKRKRVKNQLDDQPDQPQDRIDSTTLSVATAILSLPDMLKTMVLPVLAAGSAVWISRNLPTTVVHERKKRDTRPGKYLMPGTTFKTVSQVRKLKSLYTIFFTIIGKLYKKWGNNKNLCLYIAF